MTSRSEGRLAAAFVAWNARLASVGDLAFGSFWLAVLSGIALSLPYDPGAAADSLQRLLLANPAGAYLRALHYWSGQIFLVLTVLHLVEHVVRRSEARVRFGVWLRLCLSVGVVGYLMVSGYVLKDDGEGRMAREVLSGLLARLPLLGGLLQPLLVGPEGSLHLLYVQHAAMATVLSLAVIVEHFRRAWPSASGWLVSLATCAFLALALPPALHDPANPVLKGPWYLLGVQEMLHWLSRPELFWLAALVALALLLLLPAASGRWAGRIRWVLGLSLLAYLVFTGVGQFFRGASWEWRFGLGERAFDDPRVYRPDARFARADVPLVLGRREGCLPCHTDVHGLDSSHAPAAIGCASCHRGRPWTGNASLAHAGMERVPGNLGSAPATCGTTGCHGAIVARVEHSLMASGAGLVGVDRWVFGEGPDPNQGGDLRSLGTTAADTHLGELCASCHLGTAKEAAGPIDELSRGGGCLACHLDYGSDVPGQGDRGLGRDKGRHPALRLVRSNQACFGCHSRSGRISTSYEGWHETQQPAEAARGRADLRLLLDGRVFERQPADVHHEAGLLCVDCHTAREVMGDGQSHGHEEEAVEVACADCHFAGPARTVAWAELDAESQAIVRLRTGREPRARRFLAARRTGLALVGCFLDEGGQPVLEGKSDGRRHRLKAPSPACTGLGHERVTCSACHSAWAAQCLSCHTQRLADGSWREMAADFRAEAPSLGVRGGPPGLIQPFAPGMILTLSREPVAMRDADHGFFSSRGEFHRLFAPIAPHTTSRAGRGCRSCHVDPLALGLGRGALRLQRQPPPRFTFGPALPALRDGLPADAWTSFLGAPREPGATRTDARPLTADEQRRILRVGACLECHEPTAGEQARIYADFARARRRASPRCTVPWPEAP